MSRTAVSYRAAKIVRCGKRIDHARQKLSQRAAYTSSICRSRKNLLVFISGNIRECRRAGATHVFTYICGTRLLCAFNAPVQVCLYAAVVVVVLCSGLLCPNVINASAMSALQQSYMVVPSGGFLCPSRNQRYSLSSCENVHVIIALILRNA